MGPFSHILAKMNFPGKIGCQFSNIPPDYHCTKNHKKRKNHSGEKYRTDGGPDRQTDNPIGRESNRCIHKYIHVTKLVQEDKSHKSVLIAT